VSLRVNRGRQRALERFSAGRATITLSNDDRALDPTYTASPYYPNVVPMRRIRVRATYAAVTYDVFNGYVDDWAQVYAPPQDAACVIQATDAFKVLQNAELLSSVFAEEVQADNPTYWWRMGDPSDSTVAIEQVGGVYHLQPVGSPLFGAASLVEYDPEGSVQFPSILGGLQRVFPEGTFPFGAAGTVEWLYRVDGTDGGNPPILNMATLPGGTVSGIQTNLNSGSGGLTVVLVNNIGTLHNVITAGVDLGDGNVHHVAITWAAGQNIKIYVDGVDRTDAAVPFAGTLANTTDKWLVGVNAVDYPPYVFSGAVTTFDEVAAYTTQLAAARATAHATALTAPWAGETTGTRVGHILDVTPWPAADRNIDPGLSTLQPTVLGGNVLSMLQKVEETEQGALFVDTAGRVRFVGRNSLLTAPYTTSQGTFGDAGSELEFADLSYVYDDQLIYNDVQVSRQDGITQVVGDATSQARYLRRSKVFDGMLYSTDAEARDLASWFLTHYKDPVLRATNLRLEPSAGNETTHFPHALGRELLDRVTVRRRPQNLGAAIDQQTLIEGISHDVTAVEWVTTWNLSPAETQTYWILGVAGFTELDTTTRLAF
jgi:hypothetical protein